MKFEYYLDDLDYRNYFAKETLPSGQTIYIEFQQEESNKYTYYGIYLEIFDKKKSIYNNDSCCKSTGKDGIKGLLWAKQKIIEFEEYILGNNRYNHKIIIYCLWSDNRRRDVYERGLTKMGYKFSRLFDMKVLMKRIN